VAAVIREKIKVDIVIADYNLPRGLTGIQVLTLLRDLLGREIPALILTGDISASTLGEIAGLGYVHRSKPIKADDLKRIVQGLLAEALPAPEKPVRKPAR
jgi:two-component system, chemotaxis family, CheB/CheR fusion protein